MKQPRRLTAEDRQRSKAQNRLMWSRLTDLSEQVEWYGMALSPEDYKHLLTAALHSDRVVPGVDGGYVVLGQSTSRMSVAEMQDLLMLIEVFGNERGVAWTLDDDGSEFGFSEQGPVIDYETGEIMEPGYA